MLRMLCVGKWALVGIWIVSMLACGGSPPPPAASSSADDEEVLRDPVLDAVVNENATRRPSRAVPTDHRSDDADNRDARRSSDHSVRGITGSLTAFEVDEAMNTRGNELMACVQQRPNRLGHVAGNIAFAVAVDARGKVEQIKVTQSDIGYAPLEQCLTDVVAAAPFPAPAGAERTTATWSMGVDPLAREATPVDPAEMTEAIERQSDATYEACELRHARHFHVVSYINRSRVLGPMTIRATGRNNEELTEEELACVTTELGRWKRIPAAHGFGKVVFELRWMEPPKPAKKPKKKPARRRG